MPTVVCTLCVRGICTCAKPLAGNSERLNGDVVVMSAICPSIANRCDHCQSTPPPKTAPHRARLPVNGLSVDVEFERLEMSYSAYAGPPMTWKRNVPRGFRRITRGVVNVLAFIVPESSATPPALLPLT